MISHSFGDLNHEVIEELLTEYSIKIQFSPFNQKWIYEALHNHLHIPMIEGQWRAEYEYALADAIDYYQATC